ncbi:MAG: hypothetical protein LBU65_17210 [Planctomycetaceae bacterium]|jgi:hypothetical protein|nr:hypothetical protein [Planctomycetaceae bacterium]
MTRIGYVLRCLLLIFLLGIISLNGCNSGKVPLKGKVTFSDDGLPLTTGIIIFSTPDFQARGEIQQDGTFRVSSEGNHDGLPAGEYDVNIVNASVEKPGTDGNGWIFLIDTKYDSVRTSGLKFKVCSSTKSYDIVVDRYVEKKK